jgi:ubiquitin-protein ligase E3 C
VAFINEHGEEEAGIDGGGIFKDFMENITRAVFDVQYGLFKVLALLVNFFHLVKGIGPSII